MTVGKDLSEITIRGVQFVQGLYDLSIVNEWELRKVPSNGTWHLP